MRLFMDVVTKGYDLIVIEDEATPLGAGPIGSNYYVPTALFVAVVVIVIMLSAWSLRRRQVRKRLAELIEKSGDTKRKIPLSIIRIKDEIRTLEAELTDSMLMDSFE